MKTKFYLLVVFFLVLQVVHPQPLTTENIPDKKIQSLFVTAKIWGFLKYYHPEVASGNFNWDQQLLKYLPRILKSNDKESFSNVFSDWINSLGKLTNVNHDEDHKNYFENNFNISWIKESELINDSLSHKLNFIKNNRFTGENHYVKYSPRKTALMVNESQVTEVDFKNDLNKLVPLFRYWNFIEYFYPYKYLMDENWDNVLKDMISKFLKIKTENEFQLALKELIAKLNDSHAWVKFSNNPKVNFFPATIKSLNGRCVISRIYNDSIGRLANLKTGDIILSANGRSLNSGIEQNLKYVPGSNLNRKLFLYYVNQLNIAADSINLRIKRADTTFQLKVKLYSDFNDFKYYDPKYHEPWKILNNIGYVNMRIIQKENVRNMMRELSNCKGLILDLRGYPNFSFYQISNYLNSEERRFYNVFYPDLSYPGKFVWSDSQTTGKKNRHPFAGKIVIIVDDQTFSLAEFAAMCFQTSDNIITIGSQTVGADGSVSVFDLMNGVKTAMSGYGIVYPNGEQSQRSGVKIDIEVKPTIKGLIQGKDEVLEKGISIISN